MDFLGAIDWSRGYLLLAVIIGLGIFGSLLILALLIVWRRSLTREQRLQREIAELRDARTPAAVDTWAIAAERVDVEPAAEDLADDEDDDDEDNLPWRDADDEEQDEEDDDPFGRR